MKKATFTMEPFSCPSCIKKIENTLVKTNGVKEANVLFNASKVRVTFDSAVTSAEAIKDLVSGLGYPVLSSKTVDA